MAGGFADARGVGRRLDVADELNRGALPRRVAREDDPDPAAGAGRSRAGIGLRNRRDVPLREFGGGQARLEILQLPVAAEKHGDVAGNGGARQLLIVVVPEHRSWRCAALNRVAQKAEQAQHRAAMWFLAENRPPVAIDELAALCPEHGEMIEDRRFPAARVIEVAGDTVLARDAARRVEELVPGPRRRRDEILAVEEHAAVGLVPHAVHMARGVRQRLNREREKVAAVLFGPVGVQRLHVVLQQRQPEAVDRGDVRQAARRRGELQLRFVQLQPRHHRHAQLHAGMRARPVVEHHGERAGDRRTRGQMRVVLLRPDVQGERRIGAPDAHRRDEVLGGGGRRGGEHEQHDEANDGVTHAHPEPFDCAAHHDRCRRCRAAGTAEIICRCSSVPCCAQTDRSATQSPP